MGKGNFGMGEVSVLLALLASGLPKPASLFSSGRSSEIVAPAVCSEERMADRGINGASEENGGEERFDSVELTLMLMFMWGACE